MKILQLITNISEGSVSKIAKDLADTINNSNNSCLIAYGRGKNAGDYDVVKIGNMFEVYTHAFMTRITDAAGFFSKKGTRDLIKKIDEYKPDIIHLHCLHGYYINIKILFKYIKNKNIPVVWTFHDCWAFTGHCVHFDDCGCQKWKTGCYNCSQKRAFPNSFFWDNSKVNYQTKKTLFLGVNNLTIVTPSEWLEKITKDSFFSNNKIVTINNGIDIESFKYTESTLREKYKINDKKIVLGVANTWNESKGLNIFFDLSDKLDGKYQIVLIGISTEEIGDWGRKIICINKTTNKKELAQWYSVADVFVNPTLEDNYPTVNLEAIACGTPVVTFETGGSAECLKYGVGASVKKNDIEALKNKIEYFCECYHADKSTGNYDLISKDYCFNKYLELYREICQGEKDY